MKYNEEHIKRLKYKLFLYGSYTNEYEALQRELFEMEELMKLENNNLKKLAKRYGINANDPKHPPEQQLIIKKVSLTKDMDCLIEERNYLGLTDFIDCLMDEDWQFINLFFIKGYSYVSIAQLKNYGKSTIARHMNDILQKGINDLKSII